MKRALAILVGLAIALVGSVAAAAWLSTGSANATATATTVNQANAPAATRVSSTVSLSWTPSTLASGAPVGGYRVLRHHGSDAPVEVCITTSASCVDTQPLAGAVQYGVIATIGTKWRGPVSDLTSFTFDDIAPVTTASVSPSPNGAGWNKTSVTVTLTATDTSGVDRISYTVDGGSLVTVTGATTSFTVSGAGNHTVTYSAVDGVGNPEAAKTLPVKIDPNAPVTTVTPSLAENAAGWNNTDVTLNFASTDSGTSGLQSITAAGATTPVSGAPTTASTSRTVTAEGTTTVSYFAADVADNVEGTKSTTVKIDKTKPTSSISPASSSSWIKQASQSVTITGLDSGGPAGGNSGVASIVYSIDAGNAVTVNGSTATFAVGQGDHTVTYHAVDVAGNIQSDQSAMIRVDSVAPVSSISPVSSSTWRTSGAVTFTATDAASGVASFLVKIDGGSTQTLPATAGSAALPSALSDGSHTVTFQAVDSAGNTETPANSATIKVDTVRPTVTPIGPMDSGSYKGNTGSWGKLCTGNTDGVCATIADAGGTAASGVDASTLTFSLILSPGTPGAKCWDGTNFVTGSSCSVTMSYSAGSSYASSPVPSSKMALGSYSLTYSAKDNAGNGALTSVVSFTITN